MRRVILPRANEKDMRELPEHVRQEMEVVLADKIEDVLAAAVPGLAERPLPVAGRSYEFADDDLLTLAGATVNGAEGGEPVAHQFQFVRALFRALAARQPFQVVR